MSKIKEDERICSICGKTILHEKSYGEIVNVFTMIPKNCVPDFRPVNLMICHDCQDDVVKYILKRKLEFVKKQAIIENYIDRRKYENPTEEIVQI